jgi:ABC-type phosphate transport system substrate-binding protein
LVSTAGEFVAALQALRLQAHDPPFHQMSRRARNARLYVPASTLRDASSIQDRLPAQRTVRAFLYACGVTAKEEQEVWDQAWKRARWAESRAPDAHVYRNHAVRRQGILAAAGVATFVAVVTVIAAMYLRPSPVSGGGGSNAMSAAGGIAEMCESGSLQIEGSSAAAPAVMAAAASYQSTCNGALVSVEGIGSLRGLQALVKAGPHGAASTIAMSDGSAPPISANSALTGSPIAIVIFSMVVNEDVRVYNLTTTDIADIYAGRITNWDQLAGPDLPIRVISRTSASGTRATFQSWVLGKAGKATSSSCLESDPVPSLPVYRCEPTTSALLDTVSQTPGAIGYAEVQAASSHDGIIQTAIDGVQPTIYSVAGADGYPFWTVEHVYTFRQPPDQSPAAGFLRYLNTPQAKSLLRMDGFTPCADQAQLLADLCTER